MTAAARLTAWFRANARALPWRETPRNGYRTLVAELMAQQTQLERVVPRFIAFTARFPTLGSLAAATEDEVLKLWSGLGYYRRARLLHRLAREVVAGGGELPRTARELAELPGIGPYTAAALASMVHDERVPVFDGNIARVGARILALDGDPRRQRARDAIMAWVEDLMVGESPGEVNEALMELGAMVCTPTSPGCESCPLTVRCRGLASGDPERFPPPRKTRQPIEIRWLTAVAVANDGSWLLRVISEGPILRGLWLPPFAEIDPTRSLVAQALDLLPVDVVGDPEIRPPISHSITHRRIEVTPAVASVDSMAEVPDGWAWVDPTEPARPTSSLLAKLVRWTKNEW